MRKPCFRDYVCPCCGGELVGVEDGADFSGVEGNGCVADGRRDFGGGSTDGTGEDRTDADSVAIPPVKGEETAALEFDVRGAATTKGFGWDGRHETMPGTWMGRGHFVIATYGEVSRGGVSRLIMDGCIVTFSGRAGRTSFRTGKEACSPTVFEDESAARMAFRDAWDWTIGRWVGVRLSGTGLVERRSWHSDGYVKIAEVIPVEEYRPVRRSDALAELAAELRPKAGDAVLEGEAERLATRTDQVRSVKHGRAEWEAVDDAEPDYGGRPVPRGIVQDWSKVDLAEEARESLLRDVATRPSFGSGFSAGRGHGWIRGTRRAAGGVASSGEAERWLLRDWETGKFVRVDGGGATLVERDDCTFFERLADANGVAIGIERQFWRPEYAKWRLHVVPLCGTAAPGDGHG